jgi:hypothetical protein
MRLTGLKIIMRGFMTGSITDLVMISFLTNNYIYNKQL